MISDLKSLADEMFADIPKSFVVRVYGDAMQDAMLTDGDLIVAIRCEDAWEDGDTLLLWHIEKKKALLRLVWRFGYLLHAVKPAADEHEYYRKTEIEIRGKVLAVIRKVDA